MMGILNEYRHWFNKRKLPVIKLSKKEIMKEVELIKEKRSRHSSRERRAILFQATRLKKADPVNVSKLQSKDTFLGRLLNFIFGWIFGLKRRLLNNA